MTVLAIAAVVWLFVTVLAVALCASAARGDGVQLEPDDPHA